MYYLNKKDQEFLDTLMEMKDCASFIVKESFSLEVAAKAFFYIKFMNREAGKDNLGKFMATCSACGGQNKFYGTK